MLERQADRREVQKINREFSLWNFEVKYSALSTNRVHSCYNEKVENRIRETRSRE